MSRIKTAIQTFLIDDILSSGTDKISDDLDLIDTGQIDSLALMKLVEFLEVEFSMTLEGRDIVVENFSSLNSMVNLVEGKLN